MDSSMIDIPKQLPGDVLADVFSSLNRRSIENSRLVSRKFDRTYSQHINHWPFIDSTYATLTDMSCPNKAQLNFRVDYVSYLVSYSTDTGRFTIERKPLNGQGLNEVQKVVNEEEFIKGLTNVHFLYLYVYSASYSDLDNIQLLLAKITSLMKQKLRVHLLHLYRRTNEQLELLKNYIESENIH